VKLPALVTSQSFSVAFWRASRGDAATEEAKARIAARAEVVTCIVIYQRSLTEVIAEYVLMVVEQMSVLRALLYSQSLDTSPIIVRYKTSSAFTQAVLASASSVE
jgi:hypothetical protein